MIVIIQRFMIGVLLGALLFLLVGCDMPEFYRYQCMNSKNWSKPECKRPDCEILGECPDQLMKPELTKGQNNER